MRRQLLAICMRLYAKFRVIRAFTLNHGRTVVAIDDVKGDFNAFCIQNVPALPCADLLS